VLISKPLVPPEQLKPLPATHLDYMIGLEKRGLLFASGPLNEADTMREGKCEQCKSKNWKRPWIRLV